MITNLQSISRPSRRVYVKRNKIPKILGGLGLAIISTSRGVLSDRVARRFGVGGEVLCSIWLI
jgi:small subunit ribosomal protein S8